MDSDWDGKVFNSSWTKEQKTVAKEEVTLEEENVESLESGSRGKKRQTK